MASSASTVKAWTFQYSGYPTCLSQTSIKPYTSADVQPTYILVRVHAAALNPVDIQVMNLPIWNIPLSKLQQPKPVCCDFAGEVLAIGAEAEANLGLKVGDEVHGVSKWLGWAGTMAEVAMVDSAAATVARRPAGWSWEMAAAVPLVWQTARTLIARAEPYVSGAGAKVAVLGGSSSVGMYMVHMARARGWKVLSSCSGRNAEFVRGMGADDVVDYTQTSVPDAVRRFAPDVILDCVGGTECIGLSRRYLTIVGDKTGRDSLGGAMTYFWNPRMLLRMVMGRLGLSNVVYDCVNIEMNKEWLEEAGRLPHDKVVIDGVYGFDKVKEAFERLQTGRTRGKVVVKVSE